MNPFLERMRRKYICTSVGQLCWLSPPCKGSMESMEADFRMTGEEEMEGEEESRLEIRGEWS